MKPFQKLLLAPAALGLMAPVAASAADLNIAGVSQYGSEEQVTSITQFSDVKPTDWAYQALSNLIERYGCVAGYPNGTFKGGQAMTRYEAAALLNACLDRITEQTDELKRLMKEFEKELAVLKGRVDALEAKVGELEATQFSTTTKLKGIATFVLGGNNYSGNNTPAVNMLKAGATIPAGGPNGAFARAGNPSAAYTAAGQGALTFNYDVRLNFDTSFTGKDLLRTTLRAGNFANTAYGNGVLPVNSLEVAFQENCGAGVDCGDVVAINRLFYQFPAGDFTFTVGGKVRQDDMLAMWPSVYPADTILDVFTYAGSPAAYSLNLGAGAGVWYQKNGFSVSANYVAQDGSNGNPSASNTDASGGIGTDASDSTFTTQVGYAGSNWGAAVAYTYGNGSTIPAGTPLASYGNYMGTSIGTDGVRSNTVGLSAYWQPSTSGIIPSISAGWGITGLSGGMSTGVANVLAPFQSLRGMRVQSWTVGLQWADAFVKGNAAGMAVGQAPFVTALPSNAGRTANDSNYAWEWWYKFQVTDNISVTPALYYLSQAAGQLGKTNFTTGAGNVSVNNFGGVIKTTFKF